MKDIEILDARVRSFPTKKEQIEELKHWHIEAQRDALKNARDFEVGKKSELETQQNADDCTNIRTAVEARLKRTEAGKDYLYSEEARNVAKQLHSEDELARQKIADANKVTQIEEKLEKNPPLQAAEENITEISQTEGERKASELMAFLASKSIAKSKIKLHQAAELEDEKKKEKGKNPGNDFGMG